MMHDGSAMNGTKGRSKGKGVHSGISVTKSIERLPVCHWPRENQSNSLFNHVVYIIIGKKFTKFLWWSHRTRQGYLGFRSSKLE